MKNTIVGGFWRYLEQATKKIRGWEELRDDPSRYTTFNYNRFDFLFTGVSIWSFVKHNRGADTRNVHLFFSPRPFHGTEYPPDILN